LFGEEDDSCNEEDTDAEDVMNESTISSTTTEDSYNMAKHGKPKQVNRFRGSDRAFRKGHSAYDNMLAGMESQVNETDLSNCMIKWFSVRRPVDCFPVGEEEPIPGKYTCR
jgi:hypothetical protein